MAVIQPRPTHILYQCAKCGDDRMSFKGAHKETRVPFKHMLN